MKLDRLGVGQVPSSPGWPFINESFRLFTPFLLCYICTLLFNIDFSYSFYKNMFCYTRVFNYVGIYEINKFLLHR